MRICPGCKERTISCWLVAKQSWVADGLQCPQCKAILQFRESAYGADLLVKAIGYGLVATAVLLALMEGSILLAVIVFPFGLMVHFISQGAAPLAIGGLRGSLRNFNSQGDA